MTDQTTTPADVEWIEGVTETYVECLHGVRIMAGTYLRDQVPTGEHPDCLTAFAAEEAEEAERYEQDRWNEYLSTLSIREH